MWNQHSPSFSFLKAFICAKYSRYFYPPMVKFGDCASKNKYCWPETAAPISVFRHCLWMDWKLTFDLWYWWSGPSYKNSRLYWAWMIGTREKSTTLVMKHYQLQENIFDVELWSTGCPVHPTLAYDITCTEWFNQTHIFHQWQKSRLKTKRDKQEVAEKTVLNEVWERHW